MIKKKTSEDKWAIWARWSRPVTEVLSQNQVRGLGCSSAKQHLPGMQGALTSVPSTKINKQKELSPSGVLFRYSAKGQ